MTMEPIINNSLDFPECTSVECTVDTAEKQRVAAAISAAGAKSSCELTERCVASCAAYGRICPCAARIAAHSACEAMQELQKDSVIFVSPENADEEDGDCKPNFPYMNTEDIVIGKKIGEGGFSNVNLCTVTVGNEAGQQFAVKYLKRRAMVDLHQFKHGAADLAIEAYFLQVLNHPNIVKLHGVTAGSVESAVASGKECGFFIVVDRLTHTLEQQLERWREEHDQSKTGLISRFSSEHKHKKREELMERIKIALAIADALAYLHSLNIIFRDLKPDNIGFEESGQLKIFDFGLAKELKPGMERADGKYELTGNTGSRRYMAPEVAKECPYDKSVDVYSFGILLWEVCSGEKPFYGYSSGKHMQQVVLNGERPKMDTAHTANWPANLQWLINRCWSPFAIIRPSFPEIQAILRDILDGKESIPHGCVESSDSHPKIVVPPPAGGFSLFKPLSDKGRSRTCDVVEAPKNGFHSLKPPSNNKSSGRSRSWGFSLRR